MDAQLLQRKFRVQRAESEGKSTLLRLLRNEAQVDT